MTNKELLENAALEGLMYTNRRTEMPKQPDIDLCEMWQRLYPKEFKVIEVWPFAHRFSKKCLYNEPLQWEPVLVSHHQTRDRMTTNLERLPGCGRKILVT